MRQAKGAPGTDYDFLKVQMEEKKQREAQERELDRQDGQYQTMSSVQAHCLQPKKQRGKRRSAYYSSNKGLKKLKHESGLGACCQPAGSHVAQADQEYHINNQAKHTRREYDLNDPNSLRSSGPLRDGGENEQKLGPSSLQVFAGEVCSAVLSTLLIARAGPQQG